MWRVLKDTYVWGNMVIYAPVYHFHPSIHPSILLSATYGRYAGRILQVQGDRRDCNVTPLQGTINLHSHLRAIKGPYLPYVVVSVSLTHSLTHSLSSYDHFSTFRPDSLVKRAHLSCVCVVLRTAVVLVRLSSQICCGWSSEMYPRREAERQGECNHFCPLYTPPTTRKGCKHV